MRGQATTEFVMIFMILLVGLIIVVTGSLSNIIDMTNSKTRIEAQSLANQASSKINTAYLEGDGFSTNLTLPETIFGLNYTVAIENEFVSLDFGRTVFSRALMTENITGSFMPGTNLIRNSGGGIAITNL